ncbi:MAG TPA: ribonuclease HII [Drouetiella sp.]
MPSSIRRKKDIEEKIDSLRQLILFDRQHKYKGRSRKPQCYLIGTDEVGRGCLAGPVVAAAVMLPEIEEQSELEESLCELNDSKKLSAAQRERLAAIINSISICAVEEASVPEIDDINILHASLLAMRRAMTKVKALIPDLLPTLILVDGNKAMKDVEHLQTPVIQGDSSSASIAAASIIAKVYRDKLMLDLSKEHPEYGWHQNKGYGSSSHREALRRLGMTHYHRRLFSEKFVTGTWTEDIDHEQESDELVAALN